MAVSGLHRDGSRAYGGEKVPENENARTLCPGALFYEGNDPTKREFCQEKFSTIFIFP